MKKTYYKWLGRIMTPFVITGLKINAKITGQQRARVLVRSTEGEILLIWEIIGLNRWSLPGGGVEHGEAPAETAARELLEETGVTVPPEELQPVAFFKSGTAGVGYDAYIFTLTIDKQVTTLDCDPKEILDYCWVTPDNLPADLSPLVRPSLENLSK